MVGSSARESEETGQGGKIDRPPTRRGKFITFEGIDGAGKSTHIDAAIDLLRSEGFKVVSTREPGGTPLGEKLRELVLHEPMHLETETLLMFAARREHIVCVIEPALLRGDWVVCDRFTDATYAYQGGGRGLDVAKIETLERWVHGNLQPDLTFLFDLSTTVAQWRIQTQGKDTDRFEQEKADFHARVREAYLSRASRFRRFCVLDADQTRDEIKKLIEESVLSYCSQ
ncbi:MAG: dTMP kinase [Candidatus Accumulibacter sp.]|jgi:dTMP kinase|nr:dTMP kinase [Accumulibacter sp.]